MGDFMEEFKKRQEQYIGMSASELASLSDQELYEAAIARTESKVLQEDLIDGIRAMSRPEQVFYVTFSYDAEIMNGGLCQFFVNSSRAFAPLVAECLGEISAMEHKELFEDFVSENRIDLNDLSSFVIEDAYEFEIQMGRYPFDTFDNSFYSLEPIQEYLTAYLRAHADSF